ncbi:hypothetical protein J2S49_001166 [Arcanobacterium wilhelmae]|uniref:Uncharacterized protein n=1 Tax=Arcanobacterium wilhelmae TaxID=1803177 RepID=A0ABT9NC69_9ACTO|nr:hypothetical protein [Arcanobacterium wilhelmae]
MLPTSVCQLRVKLVRRRWRFCVFDDVGGRKFSTVSFCDTSIHRKKIART